METKLIPIKSEYDLALSSAASLLRDGQVVAIPTETVYGLAADATNPDAVRKIFEAKGRPADNPLIVHISEMSELAPLVREIPDKVGAMADAFWPGPLTMIMYKSDLIPSVTSGGLDTVAVRMPENKYARDIIKACGLPLAAPSANISGSPSPTNAKYVYEDMNGRIPLIIDGGPCSIGVESTVISFTGERPRLLRPGKISPEEIRDLIGDIEIDDAVLHKLGENETASSPGMKYKHYAPKADITVVKGSLDKFITFTQDKDCFVLCFEGEEKYFKNAVTFGRADDGLSEAGRIFDALRELDEKGAKTVYARCPSTKGVGLAVYNRLIRSAGFKIIDLQGKAMKVIGLTGQTGAGKSTVARALWNYGFYHIDADTVAKEVIDQNEDVKKALVAEFGDVLSDDGKVNRSKLAKAAFKDIQSTEKLNEITDPAITEEIHSIIKVKQSEGYRGVILDAIALFESGEDSVCDLTVSVIAPEDIRLKRIMKRDKLSEESALLRIRAQKDQDYFTEKSDYIIRNYPPYDLQEELLPIINSL